MHAYMHVPLTFLQPVALLISLHTLHGPIAGETTRMIEARKGECDFGVVQ